MPLRNGQTGVKPRRRENLTLSPPPPRPLLLFLSLSILLTLHPAGVLALPLPSPCRTSPIACGSDEINLIRRDDGDDLPARATALNVFAALFTILTLIIIAVWVIFRLISRALASLSATVTTGSGSTTSYTSTTVSYVILFHHLSFSPFPSHPVLYSLVGVRPRSCVQLRFWLGLGGADTVQELTRKQRSRRARLDEPDARVRRQQRGWADLGRGSAAQGGRVMSAYACLPEVMSIATDWIRRYFASVGDGFRLTYLPI